MFDHDPGVLDDNAINHQLEDLLLDCKGGINQGVTNAGTEALQSLQQTDFLLPIVTLPFDVLDPLTQEPGVLVTSLSSLLAFRKFNHPALIGVNQPKSGR